MDYVLRTDLLTKFFKKKAAVNKVSMNVPKGAIYGLIGINGAGKTTIMRMVAGLAAPSGGSIELFGSNDLVANRSKLGCVIENPALYPNMTARENLEAFRRLAGIEDESIIDSILETVGLKDVDKKKKAKNFSLGMKQRLSIGIALIGDPEFLILDEPINGLDPTGIAEMRDLFLKLKEQGKTILISSHILGELSKLATHYGFIHNGKIIKEISAAELEMSMDKCVEVEVRDTMLLSRALDKLGKKFEIMSNTTARIYGELTATEVFKALDGENCEIISMNNINRMDANLENYFINLVGGGQYE